MCRRVSIVQLMGAQLFTAVLLHFAGLKGLAVHGSDFELHKVWEVPLACSSQLMYPSRHISCRLPVTFPSSWTHDIQEGKALVDFFILNFSSILIFDTAWVTVICVKMYAF